MARDRFSLADEKKILEWIRCIRDASRTFEERSAMELSIHDRLHEIASSLAQDPSNIPGYDAQQVANDAICILLVDYVRESSKEIPSVGHLVQLLVQIVRNERRMLYRNLNRSKRTPRDSDANRQAIESLDMCNCKCGSTDDDPSRICQHQESFNRCMDLLPTTLHQHVFVMLYANSSQVEMAMQLELDPRTIRKLVRQIRSILQRTQHSALSTRKHKAQSTKHKAQSTRAF
jgi:DNA-directed RNA polymerase specialized sigma24 family protein